MASEKRNTGMSPRRTKIVCTIGPASGSPETLQRLIDAGMDVARLNFSHGTHDEKAETIRLIRAISDRLGKPVAILQDLAGPKVRIGNLAAGPVRLEPGQRFTLTNRSVPGDAREVSLTYAGLPGDVRCGDTLLLSDGALEVTVVEATPSDIVCRVVVGGTLAPHKGINVPSRSLNVSFPTDKDRRDLAFGIEHGVDYVALSFVRTAADVVAARRVAQALTGGEYPPLIAKIEKHEALAEIDAILREADGIMVARGDLGVEIPIERVPRVQKALILKANESAKPVITATQMLRSMVESPRPTRAEATDVANAIMDGTDAVMLSEETAEGKYPVESVQMMDRLARDAEEAGEGRSADGNQALKLRREEAVALAAARLAEQIGAAAIVTCTQSGSTTRLVSKQRPRIPLLAVTPDNKTLRRMALVWGAVPLSMNPADGVEAMERQALQRCMHAGLVREGDVVVVTAGLPLHVPGTTNMVKVTVMGRESGAASPASD